MSDSPEDVLDQIAFHAPLGVVVPSLLRDLVAWAAAHGEGLGYFRFEGNRIDGHYIEDGTRCAAAFFSFLRTSDGSMVGWCLRRYLAILAPILAAVAGDLFSKLMP